MSREREMCGELRSRLFP